MSGIIFDKKTHTYFSHGIECTSVTSVIHTVFPVFDSKKVSEKVAKSQKSKYYGQCPKAIREKWKRLGDDAACSGTKLHEQIEHFYKEKTKPQLISKEFNHFLRFHDEISITFGKPLHSEFVTFSVPDKVAGTIDMLYEKPNGDITMVDWKRVETLLFDNNFESLHSPFEEYPATNFWKYAFQLNLYKRLFEQQFSKNVVDMYLVLLHPNNAGYVIQKVPNLKYVAEKLLKHRELSP